METIGDFRELLGEGPVWCDLDKALYWTDIRRRLIRRHVPTSGATTSWEFPELVGSFALRREGGLLIALASRLVTFDPESGNISTLAAPEADKPTHRFNDGKCDPAGRFLVGSMNDATREPTGSLWSLDGGSCRALLGGCNLPNGLAWSPDGSRLYFSDTLTGEIRVFNYDTTTGAIGAGRIFARVSDGGPDGATVDAEGFYWCAVYGGWRLERYAPDGRLDRTIDLPVQNPTSCAFGGADFDQLYVTTASQRLTPEELAQQPLAGAILVLDVGVRGLPSVRYSH